MDMEMLIYCPLMEEEGNDVTGWEKSTIDYVSNHKRKIQAQIRGIAKTQQKRSLQTADVDDVFGEILMYLYHCDDYNISKAVERSSTDTPVTLEGYLNSCIKYCVIRYCNNIRHKEKDTVRETTVDSDGKELSILDNISDKRSLDNMEDVMYDLETLCKSYESIRYKYGPDIYLVIYVSLLTDGEKNKDLKRDILSILGINKKELLDLKQNSSEDDVMSNFVRSINIVGIENAKDIIRKYVFAAKIVEDTINKYI